MPFYFPHSVTDLVCRKTKEILVFVYSIPSIYKIQTFNNVNRRILRKRKQSDINVIKIFQVWMDWGQKANESNNTKIVERFTD